MTTAVRNGFDFDDPALVSACDELSLWSAPFGMTLLDEIEYRRRPARARRL